MVNNTSKSNFFALAIGLLMFNFALSQNDLRSSYTPSNQPRSGSPLISQPTSVFDSAGNTRSNKLAPQNSQQILKGSSTDFPKKKSVGTSESLFESNHSEQAPHNQYDNVQEEIKPEFAHKVSENSNRVPENSPPGSVGNHVIRQGQEGKKYSGNSVSSPAVFKEFKDTSKLNHPADLPSRLPHKSKSHDTKTCKGRVRDPSGHMTDAEINLICSMYDDWSRRMQNGSHWQPTKKQKKWFENLGLRTEGRRKRRQAQGKAIRREYRMMTDAQRDAYHRAINTLKNTYVDGMNRYDVFVNYHQPDQAPAAHFGPAFYGFHREMVFRFENALREIDPTVSVPYWDANLDQMLGNTLATKTLMWTEKFIGNGNGPVTTGPFANWRILYPSRNGQTVLYRALDEPVPPFLVAPALVSDEAILSLMSARSIRDISWNIDNRLESHHGGVHNYIGGVMSELSLSAADPIFFPLHAFFDCLYEQFRRQQLTRQPVIDPRYDYPNDSEALGVGLPQPDGRVINRMEDSAHYMYAPMRPFTGLRNIDGLRNDYTDFYYECETSPTCSQARPDCGSPYLFCDRATHRCVPKLVQGAQCEAFAASNPCYESTCCQGVCSANCAGGPQGREDTGRSAGATSVGLRGSPVSSSRTSRTNNYAPPPHLNTTRPNVAHSHPPSSHSSEPWALPDSSSSRRHFSHSRPLSPTKFEVKHSNSGPSSVSLSVQSQYPNEHHDRQSFNSWKPFASSSALNGAPYLPDSSQSNFNKIPSTDQSSRYRPDHLGSSANRDRHQLPYSEFESREQFRGRP